MGHVRSRKDGRGQTPTDLIAWARGKNATEHKNLAARREVSIILALAIAIKSPSPAFESLRSLPLSNIAIALAFAMPIEVGEQFVGLNAFNG